MTETPTLHLTVGLPGVGKTTLARKIAHEDKAVRFTPDEWMIPLFETTWLEPDVEGKRDVLEGRLLWAAHEVLGVGGSVVLDFGCWAILQARFGVPVTIIEGMKPGRVLKGT